MSEALVTEAMCQARRQLDDERFARDKSRIGKAEERLDKLEALIHEMGDCNTKLTVIVENQAKMSEDHESRITEIEKRPGTYWDKVVAGIIGAAVTAFVALVFKGGVPL